VESLEFNVLILDDHVLVAQALANCLSEVDGVGDVMVASTTDEAAAYVTTAAPEVVVVDYRLDGSFGTDFIKEMRELGSVSAYVILTAADTSKVRNEARLAGALCCIHKSSSLHDLTQEIVRIGSPLARMDREAVEEAMRAGSRSTLTVREREVLQCVLTGMSNKDIARTLFLSPNTVRNHLTNVKHKLGAKSKLELAATAPLPRRAQPAQG
jgi:DNA-binding NarL/FixJ family response regulator